MIKFTKFFMCITFIVIFITSPVLASNTVSSPTNTTSATDDDLFISNEDTYTIDQNVNGNAFITSDKLILTARNSNLIFNGDLFASTVNTTISSDLIYSDNKDKIGNYIIDDIKSYVNISGNVYIVATDTFTLESGSQIHGDLYVCGTNVNINENAIITGNVFAFANSTINLHGKIYGSVYASANTCNMNYTGNIAKDLILHTNNANISGKVDRHTKISSTNGKIITTSDFINNRDLKIEADEFEFAGEVQGNANISAKSLSFNTDKKCIIRGNLTYATQSEISISEGIVNGETKIETYKEKNSFSYILFNKFIGYLSLLAYVFVLALIFKRITPTFVEKLSNITITNIFIGLGIGFGSLLLIVPAFVLLVITRFTIGLAFVLLISMMFIASIAVPLLILAIANSWKAENINVYLKMFIITTIIFAVSFIPYIGTIGIFTFTLISLGRILSCLFVTNKL